VVAAAQKTIILTRHQQAAIEIEAIMLAMLGRIWNGPVVYRGAGVEVRDRAGVRTLHLGSDTVQSAMRLDDPYELELSYTRAMLGFLLFAKMPKEALLVGLGGGSIAKFIHAHMPETRARVIEVSAEVVEVARAYFNTPPDDDRFAVIVDEGAGYVARIRQTVDLLLVDAYDGRSLAASLASDDFFRAACAALNPGGVFVMNLWSSDRSFDRYVKRIEQAFANRCLCLPAERPGNVIVFGFATIPTQLKWTELDRAASELQERFGLEFRRFVQGLKQMNKSDASGVLI
jgi:spermidine synthase